MVENSSPKQTRRIGPHSRAFARGSLGDVIDGRSKEGRFIRRYERDMIDQLGGSPTTAQLLLIRRVARAAVQMEMIDRQLAKGEISAHAARVFSALSNQVRLGLRELGLRAAPAPEQTLQQYLASRGTD